MIHEDVNLIVILQECDIETLTILVFALQIVIFNNISYLSAWSELLQGKVLQCFATKLDPLESSYRQNSIILIITLYTIL